jgi:hypothetical protein
MAFAGTCRALDELLRGSAIRSRGSRVSMSRVEVRHSTFRSPGVRMSKPSEHSRVPHNATERRITGDANRRRGLQAAVACSLLLLGGAVIADSDRDSEHGRGELRQFIARQVGGIDKLIVPATNAEIPVPPGPATQPDRYDTTEAKRFLGKMLFHDPVRTARININKDVPVNLPAGTAFGGTVNANRPGRAAPATSARRQPRPASSSTCTSAPRAAATPTRRATSSPAVAHKRSSSRSAPRRSFPATRWWMGCRR